MRVKDRHSAGAGTVLLGIVAIALAGVAGSIGLINQIDDFGPKVGDIVSFDPLDPMSLDMHARLPAMPVNEKPGAACVLDVRTMHANGGSVIVESRDPRPSFGYRVHWAGTHSSTDGADCGASADLLVNLDDIELMATAAGGYGATASKHVALLLGSANTAAQ